jgi:DNA-binding beta-propeller fold protein YncE
MLSVGMKHIMKFGVMVLLLITFGWMVPTSAHADKKKNAPAQAKPSDGLNWVDGVPDFTTIVFPPAPSVPRIRYLDYFASSLPELPKAERQKQKAGWMDRLAGVDPNEGDKKVAKVRYHLFAPYGVAVDSKGLLYIADTKVGAVFIFNTENDHVELIKAGVDAQFKNIFGLAMDDADHLFVADAGRHEILEFDATHKYVGAFGFHDLRAPCGIAIDSENRFFYVADPELDQVVVFNADTHAVLRKFGTTGKNHTLTDAGNFSKPTNVAVGKDGNVYVVDTLNDRVEIFDADGNFIRTFGQNGDAVGNFARPKGITVDSDGHVWVADAMLNRIQVFTPEGQVLMSFGGYGIGPAQFQALTGLTFDAKRNRLFAAEQIFGRVQMFRYYTDEEARIEIAKRRAGKSDEAAIKAKPEEVKSGPQLKPPPEAKP